MGDIVIELDELLGHFYDEKQNADMFKKNADEYNTQIKNMMQDLGLTEYEGRELTAKLTTQNRESFNDGKLLKILEDYKEMIPGLIVMKPTVDMEKLESAIYNGVIDASILTPAKEVKEVLTLKVKPNKKKMEG